MNTNNIDKILKRWKDGKLYPHEIPKFSSRSKSKSISNKEIIINHPDMTSLKAIAVTCGITKTEMKVRDIAELPPREKVTPKDMSLPKYN